MSPEGSGAVSTRRACVQAATHVLVLHHKGGVRARALLVLAPLSGCGSAEVWEDPEDKGDMKTLQADVHVVAALAADLLTQGVASLDADEGGDVQEEAVFAASLVSEIARFLVDDRVRSLSCYTWAFTPFTVLGIL